MQLYILIFGLCICATTTGCFLYFRINKGGICGLFSKTIASVSFVVFALLLSFSKMQVAYNNGLAIAFLISGLVCGLVGDILLDLKVMYQFHEKSYLKAGICSFLFGHIFYIIAIAIVCSYNFALFSATRIIILSSMILGSIVLSILIWIFTKKAMNFDYNNNALLVNLYSTILLFTTAFSIFMTANILSLQNILLSVGLISFLASDLVLSLQYFGGKQDSKNLTIVNHILYYIAQILIASFIFFI